METSRLGPSWLREMHQDELRTYAALSGDWNPIHLDREQAVQAGHADTICHGMLAMTDIGSWLAKAMAGWQLVTFSCRFVTPMRVGTRLRIAGQEDEARFGCGITIDFVAEDRCGDVKVRGQATFKRPG